MARVPTPGRRSAEPITWGDLLSLDRSLTGVVSHLIYWAGLALIVLAGFGVIGAFVGGALREGSLEGVLLALPGLVAGALGVLVAALLWRWMCEFYVAVFHIAEDLRALRLRDAPPTAAPTIDRI